jgi:aspartate-semialdehyde dehydrogenase
MKKITSLIAAVFLAVSLAGCAGFVQKVETAVSVVTSASVTPQEAYIAINAFDAVEATTTNVLRVPLCNGTRPVCRPLGVREQINKTVLAGRVARNEVKAYMRANPGQSISIQSFSDLKSATSSLQVIVSTYQSAS